MNSILQHAALAFLISASVAWGWEQISETHIASPHTKAACHGEGSSFWEMQRAYYSCLDRVEAGGKP